jgi:hypothetical protein
MIRQTCCHGRGARPPHLRRTTTIGGFRYQEWLAQTGVGQYKVVIDVEQRQLIPHACFTLAQGIDPAPDRCYSLTEVEVETLDKRRVDRPATSR